MTQSDSLTTPTLAPRTALLAEVADLIDRATRDLTDHLHTATIARIVSHDLLLQWAADHNLTYHQLLHLVVEVLDNRDAGER